MLGQGMPFVLAILSLLVIDIYGIQRIEDVRRFWRCHVGTPAGSDCNPRTFPSTCQNGFYCQSATGGFGFCCPGLTCPSGGGPVSSCILLGANQCPSGHFCSRSSLHELGSCCPLRCQNRGIPNGRCVPSVPNQCAEGFFCQEVPDDIRGVCCPIVQPPLGVTGVITSGSCPVVNNVGPCVILPNNCTSDDECRQGQRCCPDGCGKVCKYV